MGRDPAFDARTANGEIDVVDQVLRHEPWIIAAAVAKRRFDVVAAEIDQRPVARTSRSMSGCAATNRPSRGSSQRAANDGITLTRNWRGLRAR